MHSKVYVEITYPFLNSNGCTVEVQEWKSNFTPHFMIDILLIYAEVKGVPEGNRCLKEDAMTWERFALYRTVVKGIYRSPNETR